MTIEKKAAVFAAAPVLAPVLVLVLVLITAAAAFSKEPIDGVWGLQFGASPEAAHKVMEGHGAKLLCEYGYQPEYREAFYDVDFFGRTGHLLLRFSPKGLFLARFAFVRKGAAPKDTTAAANETGARKYAAITSNYSQLHEMLNKKYGAPDAELDEKGVVRGMQWRDGAFNRASITLFESRSRSREDTVLSYEDSRRR